MHANSINSQKDPICRQRKDLFGWMLIICSSVLLGIWAVKDTIALRNILLVLGSIGSLIYIVQFFKNNSVKIPLKNWTPLILLGLLFFWVILHYCFLSKFPDIQFAELISIWVRCLLAVIFAAGVGLALFRRPEAINYLWIGILMSFFYLLYQYIPRAILANNVFVIDYLGYIYLGKHHGVLMGTILVAGLSGTFIDTIKTGKKGSRTLFVGFLWLFGIAATFYSYVFVFDARNGVALGACILAISLPVLFWSIFTSLTHRRTGNVLLLIMVSIFILAALGWFGAQHIKHNPGLLSIWDDTKTSIQIDKYPNWQDPRGMGYPLNETGGSVKGNTYERIAWANAGLRIFLPQNPLGIGIMRNPFSTLLKEAGYKGADYIPSTHSAWVDLGLSFGYPGLLLALGALVSILFLSMASKSQFRFLGCLLTTGFMLIFTTLEPANYHGIEILFFFIALMATLLLPLKSPHP